jgi:hypothetical protein
VRSTDIYHTANLLEELKWETFFPFFGIIIYRVFFPYFC